MEAAQKAVRPCAIGAPQQRFDGAEHKSARSPLQAGCEHRNTITQRLKAGIHYGKVTCLHCGRFVGWSPKPQTLERRKILAFTLARLAMRNDLSKWQRKFVSDLAHAKKISPRQQEIVERLSAQYSAKPQRHGLPQSKTTPKSKMKMKMKKTRSYREFSDSRYLKKEALTEPQVVTLESVEEENVARDNEPKKVKLIARFVELEKPVVLNMTNCTILGDTAGTEDFTQWKGIQVEIFNDLSVRFGTEKGGIRFRPVKTWSQAKTKPRPATEAEMVEYGIV